MVDEGIKDFWLMRVSRILFDDEEVVEKGQRPSIKPDDANVAVKFYLFLMGITNNTKLTRVVLKVKSS